LTGQSANEFIPHNPIEEGAQLLEQNQLTIAEITYEVGFGDLQYFRECFKKVFWCNTIGVGQRTAGIRLWANNKLKLKVMIRRNANTITIGYFFIGGGVVLGTTCKRS